MYYFGFLSAKFVHVLLYFALFVILFVQLLPIFLLSFALGGISER